MPLLNETLYLKYSPGDASVKYCNLLSRYLSSHAKNWRMFSDKFDFDMICYLISLHSASLHHLKIPGVKLSAMDLWSHIEKY
jgi:hypothetical protein